MSDKEFDNLRVELAAFSRRLKAKIQEFQDRGAFSNTQEAFVERIQRVTRPSKRNSKRLLMAAQQPLQQNMKLSET